MAEFQKVRGSHEISIRAADLLEDMRPQDFNGSNRTKQASLPKRRSCPSPIPRPVRSSTNTL